MSQLTALPVLSRHQFFSGATVDLNMFPIGLIDHIDILLDGASAIYGSDAVGGVFNVWLIHKFRDVEIYRAMATPISALLTIRLRELAYVLAGTGDDKTDIVVYAEVLQSRRHLQPLPRHFL